MNASINHVARRVISLCSSTSPSPSLLHSHSPSPPHDDDDDDNDDDDDDETAKHIIKHIISPRVATPF